MAGKGKSKKMSGGYKPKGRVKNGPPKDKRLRENKSKGFS
jgi:hypothetical protein